MSGRYSSIGKIWEDTKVSGKIASAFKAVGKPTLRKSARGLHSPGADPAFIRRGKRRIMGVGAMFGLNAGLGPNGNRDTRRRF